MEVAHVDSRIPLHVGRQTFMVFCSCASQSNQQNYYLKRMLKGKVTVHTLESPQPFGFVDTQNSHLASNTAHHLNLNNTLVYPNPMLSWYSIHQHIVEKPEV